MKAVALGFEPEGREFESLRARHFPQIKQRILKNRRIRVSSCATGLLLEEGGLKAGPNRP